MLIQLLYLIKDPEPNFFLVVELNYFRPSVYRADTCEKRRLCSFCLITKRASFSCLHSRDTLKVVKRAHELILVKNWKATNVSGKLGRTFDHN